jgi:hypothetical protein
MIIIIIIIIIILNMQPYAHMKNVILEYKQIMKYFCGLTSTVSCQYISKHHKIERKILGHENESSFIIRRESRQWSAV